MVTYVLASHHETILRVAKAKVLAKTLKLADTSKVILPEGKTEKDKKVEEKQISVSFYRIKL